MDQSTLDGFRAQLNELRSDLRHQLQEQGANPDGGALDGEGYDPGFADSAHSTAERGQTLVLVERLRDQLAEVDKALGKIDAGTYGRCETCGEIIPPERLEALPYSTQCVNCKQKSS